MGNPIFKLNHSGIVFRMPFTIDLSGEIANPYMNKVEIELKQGIDEYFERMTIDPYTELCSPSFTTSNIVAY